MLSKLVAPQFLGVFDLTLFQRKYENDETFKDLKDRIDRLIPTIAKLQETHGEELPQILDKLTR